VECAFNGTPFELEKSERIIRIYANDVMWQKERLLNCAIDAVPRGISKISWLDSDIILEDDLWAVRASDALNKYSVIQPYSWSVRLPQGQTRYIGEGDLAASFAWTSVHTAYNRRLRYRDHGRTGFAWAARRVLLEMGGLYDRCIMGGGDHVMAHVFDKRSDCPCIEWFWNGCDALKKDFENWAISVSPILNTCGLGAIEGRLLHLWHGEHANRSYVSRQHFLASTHFDPDHDLRISPSGAWEWSTPKVDLHAGAAEYFASRREDGKN
jgi:hypothetical protein